MQNNCLSFLVFNAVTTLKLHTVKMQKNVNYIFHVKLNCNSIEQKFIAAYTRSFVGNAWSNNAQQKLTLTHP